MLFILITTIFHLPHMPQSPHCGFHSTISQHWHLLISPVAFMLLSLLYAFQLSAFSISQQCPHDSKSRELGYLHLLFSTAEEHPYIVDCIIVTNYSLFLMPFVMWLCIASVPLPSLWGKTMPWFQKNETYMRIAFPGDPPTHKHACDG